jgi:hypothetical protein
MARDEKIAKKNAEIYNDPQLNRVRRKERAVTDDAWIKALLRRGAFGTIATVAGEQPFMNAHNYVYDEGRNCIYFHATRASATRWRRWGACTAARAPRTSAWSTAR